MGTGDKVLRLSRNIPFLNFQNSGFLYIYSMDYDEIQEVRPILERYRGKVKYLSLRGTKDLILKSTGKPMCLLHLQYGDQAVGGREAMRGYQHMFCCHERDPLYKELKKRGVKTDIMAQIVSLNMSGTDWGFILTSDI